MPKLTRKKDVWKVTSMSGDCTYWKKRLKFKAGVLELQVVEMNTQVVTAVVQVITHLMDSVFVDKALFSGVCQGPKAKKWASRRAKRYMRENNLKEI